ncbi:NAD(P)-binding protein [Cantharellus anzutake]|uniref:NAD(P)-binding protein n=1 Tax=Cantharellus anzutake TaxID=1750568 RepID=UPI001904314D|nr:NAD(P)-binding protein [Cantharellus anzutake]KAF8343828.1 NAD(P)-binding protein [Cantharellus anzutake]
MTAIKLPATILVSGASGFIAAWVVKSILQRGFSVIGTVRSTLKGEYLKNLFEREFPGKFSYVIVEDIGKEGAFDEAVKNVDAVVHTASPFHLNATDPDEYLTPAIKGTTGILETILKYGQNVKRVVITSSAASIIHPEPVGYVFTESDWNTHDPEVVKEKRGEAPAMNMYRASKVLAERAAWEFVKTKEGIKFDLVTILPSFVFGPTIHELSGPSSLNTSIDLFRKVAFESTNERTRLLSANGSWVDVRNVADAHAESLVLEEAGGERFIVSVGPYSWQDFCEAYLVPKPSYSSGEKAGRVLGIKYISKKQCLSDTVTSLVQRGLIGA